MLPYISYSVPIKLIGTFAQKRDFMKQKILPLVLIILSLLLLVPGLTQPVLTLQGDIDKSKIASTSIDMLAEEGDSSSRRMLNMISNMLGLDELEGDIEAYQKTRSIWGTITELAKSDNVLVAVLVAAFSVVIPVIKLLLQTVLLLVNKRTLQQKIERIVHNISKWSMADVFVIAIIVAFLAGNADGQMGELLKMQAELGVGFWFFTAYCVFSILSGALVTRQVSKSHANEPN